MEAEPLTGLLPDQDPEALHAVAPVVLHRSVLAAPAVIEAGVADSEIVGPFAAAELPDTQVPRQAADSASTTSALRYVTSIPQRSVVRRRFRSTAMLGPFGTESELHRRPATPDDCAPRRGDQPSALSVALASRRAPTSGASPTAARSPERRLRVGSQAINPPIAGTQIEIA